MYCVRRMLAIALVMTFLLVQMTIPRGDLVSGTVPDVVILYPVEGETYRGTETIELNATGSFDPDGK